jgi:CheY-like chemotaxis protein
MLLMRVPNKSLHRVILIEANDAFRYVLARALRGPDVSVLDVRSALEATATLESDPGIRLAVVDHRTVSSSLGRQFAIDIRGRGQEARIVPTSANPFSHRLRQAASFGEVLLKTSDMHAMATEIYKRLGLGGVARVAGSG